MSLSAQRILSREDPLFAAKQKLYLESFPAYQRRSVFDQELVFRQPTYRLDAWLADGEFAAFMSWWEFPDMRYVEHLAVAAEKRSSGIGSALLQIWLPSLPTPAALEIDPVVDELTARRLAFYERLGFVKNSITHNVPSFINPEETTPGELLTWPRPFSDDDYARLQKHLKSTAFACIGNTINPYQHPKVP